MSHTPAPWIMEHNEESGKITVWAGSAIQERHTGIYDSAGEMEIYDCVYNDSESDKEFIANAQLIAAAPELLEALKLYQNTIAALREVPVLIAEKLALAHVMADKAISKAEGK